MLSIFENNSYVCLNMTVTCVTVGHPMLSSPGTQVHYTTGVKYVGKIFKARGVRVTHLLWHCPFIRCHKDQELWYSSHNVAHFEAVVLSHESEGLFMLLSQWREVLKGSPEAQLGTIVTR